MKRPTRSAAVGLAAALGLTIAVIPGVVSADPPKVEFNSTLTLKTNVPPNVPQLTLQGTTLSQTLATANPSLNNCNLDTDSRLLTFTGYLGEPTPTSVKPVGFKDGSLGVNEKIASVCNRVDALSTTGKLEALEIALVPELEVVNGVPVLGATSASLDIEVTSIPKLFSRQKAVVLAEAYTADATTPAVIVELKQGANGCAIPPTGSKSLMDGSNCRLNLSMAAGQYFTKLKLTARAGAFSLEGGSDTSESPAAMPTTFDLVTLVDQTFQCTGGSFLDNNAEVVYIGTAGDPDACEAFGITLDATAEEVVFLKPLGVDPDAQFIFDVTWTKPNDGSAEVTIPAAKIDFEFVGGSGFTNMEFCPPSLYDGAQLIGLPEGRTQAEILQALGSDFEPGAAFPGVQFACLDQGRGVVYGEDTIEVTDKIYLIGDAKMRL